MEKIFVRYHINGNKAISETKEFESFGEAVARIGMAVREREWIGVVRNDGHVTEIRTSNITHFDVLTERSAKLESELNHLSKMVKDVYK